MKLRLGINGFGRIGRMLLRAYLSGLTQFDHLDIIAINDIADAHTLLHLLKFDSTHGRLCVDAWLQDNHLILQKNGQTLCQIVLLNQKNPTDIAWGELGIDVVLECTGHFRSYDDASLHRLSGAKQVIIGAAPFDNVDASIVMGVNDEMLHRDLPIISGVS